MSTTWYTYLEQGRAKQASASVLESVARVLRLNQAEQDHLFVLAGDPSSSGPAPVDMVDARMTAVVDSLPYPADLVSRHDDLQAWNPAAAALFDDWQGLAGHPIGNCAGPNLLHWIFAAPYARSLFVDWATQANAVVARFRAAAARHPGDARFAEVLRQARRLTGEVDVVWSRQNVRASAAGTKAVRLPDIGVLELHHLVFNVSGTAEQRLVVCLLEPGDSHEPDFSRFCRAAQVRAPAR